MTSHRAPFLALLLGVALTLAACTGTQQGATSSVVTNEDNTNDGQGRSNTADLRRSAGRALVYAPSIEPLNVPPSSVASDNSASPQELKPPTCINLPPLQAENLEVDTTPIVDCDEAHNAQIYWAGSLNDNPDSEYPGNSTVLSVSDQICLDRFAGFIGVEYVDSDLEILHLRPDEIAWERGNRMLVCLVQHRHEANLTGSAQGSRW